MRPPVDVHILGLDPSGLMRGEDDRGRPWLVRGGVPGATVLTVGRQKKGIAVEERSPPPGAIPAPCPHFRSCGGCQMQSLPLQRQRDEKLRMLQELLAPLGQPGRIVGTEEAYGYRDKLEFSFGVKRWLTKEEQTEGVTAAGRFLGFHSPNRWDKSIDVEACLLGRPELQAVYARIRADVLPSDLPIYDVEKKEGFLRMLVLRATENGALALLYTASPTPAQDAWLREHAPTWGAAGVLWFVTDSRGDAAVGDLRAILHGADRLTLPFFGHRFDLSPTAFFQGNRPAAEMIHEIVRDAVGTGGRLLDLYCGAGAFSRSLADRFTDVIGIELHAPAVEDARRNGTATFHVGPVEEIAPALGLTRADAVVVDPPRFGLHPKARHWLAAFDAPVLAYVSCEPVTLLRDALTLQLNGWRCTDWAAVDLFPQTRHVEVVARFVRDAAPRAQGSGSPGSGDT